MSEAYYEIYNLALDAGGQSRYRLDYILEPLPENQNLASRIGTLLGVDKRKATISSSFESTGNGRMEKLYHRIEILGHPDGDYNLTLRISDRISGQNTSRQVRVKIKQKV